MSTFGSLDSSMQTQGQQQQQGTSLFGSVNTNTQPSQPLFGSLGQSSNQQPQQQNASPFGLGQNNQQQTQQSGGIFGGLNQNQQQPQAQPQAQAQPQQQSGFFGGFGKSTQQQPQNSTFGGLGQSTQQQAQQSNTFGSFGQNTQQQPVQSNLFGSVGQSTQQQNGGLFGQTQNNQQNQQNQQHGGSIFGGMNTNNQQAQGGGANLIQSQLWQPQNLREKSVLEEMKAVIDKWDPASPNCAFRHYFYNKVDERLAPYYTPAPHEDHKAWEEALSKKPGPGYIPVLCTGFQQMGERIKIQQQNLAFFNKKLHEINDSLEAMLNKHNLVLTVRALDARRRHTALKQRCLALATKAQVLRNRGYAMSTDEEVLREKLLQLEKGVCDPRLSARGEEIWARLVSVRERAKLLRDEVEKRAGATTPLLDEEALRRAEKILETYGRQLQILKKELNQIQEDFKAWEKEQGIQPTSR